MAAIGPVTRDATPRPSEEQLEEVRELATVLAAEREANAPLFDVALTPDFGFAVINVSRRIFANMTALPVTAR